MIERYFRYSANASPNTSLALSLLIRNEEQRVFPQPSLYVEATSLTSMKSGVKNQHLQSNVCFINYYFDVQNCTIVCNSPELLKCKYVTLEIIKLKCFLKLFIKI